MGLDIYLEPAAVAEANRRHYSIWEEDAEGNCLGVTMTEEERKAHDEANPYISHKDVPSERYPDHLFNRRYLRSSYNSDGFNNVVPEILGPTNEGDRGSLYWIFEPMDRDWNNGDDKDPLTVEDIPKLQECRKRASEIVDELATSDRLRVETVSPNMFNAPPQHSSDDALRIYREHVAERPGVPVGWYSTMGGDLNVYGDGLRVVAAIPGRDTFGGPAVHLLFKARDEAFDSYLQSAEIVVEFIDEAIMLIERDGSCAISWSG